MSFSPVVIRRNCGNENRFQGHLSHRNYNELLKIEKHQGGSGRRIFLTIFTVELAVLSLEYR